MRQQRKGQQRKQRMLSRAEAEKEGRGWGWVSVLARELVDNATMSDLEVNMHAYTLLVYCGFLRCQALHARVKQRCPPGLCCIVTLEGQELGP